MSIYNNSRRKFFAVIASPFIASATILQDPQELRTVPREMFYGSAVWIRGVKADKYHAASDWWIIDEHL